MYKKKGIGGRDGREKIRDVHEAQLYRYKVALNTILEYLHLGIDLNSASIDDSDISVNNTMLIGFQQYVCAKIDEYDKMSGNKTKGKNF